MRLRGGKSVSQWQKKLFAGREGREGRDAAAARPAAIASRSAALLRGGVSPRRIVAMLHRNAPSDETRAVADRVEGGDSVGRAFARLGGPSGAAWRVLGVAWQLAETSGAPLAASLDRIAEALHSVDELARKRDVLLATPRMTVRLVALLPLAALGIGFLLGFNPLPVFLTPFGAVLLVAGLVMQAAGMWWVRRLVRQVEQEDRVAGLECELVWIALAGGAPPQRARTAVVDAVTDLRAEWIEYDAFCRGRALDQALRVAVEAGVPAASLLVEAAREERSRTEHLLEQHAERLSVRILLPLAACILPAFVVLGVVPVVVRLFGDALVL